MADKSTKLTLLPVARIRTIMKSSPDVTVIGQESLFMITKATVCIQIYEIKSVMLTITTKITKLNYETQECSFVLIDVARNL